MYIHKFAEIRKSCFSWYKEESTNKMKVLKNFIFLSFILPINNKS